MWGDSLTPSLPSLPGLLLGFVTLHSLLTALINKCWRGELHRIVRGSAKAFAVALEFSLCVGFLLVDRAPTYKPSNKALPADTGTTEIKQ